MNSMRTSKWNTHPKAVVGLGYGDEGKGMTVATLVHEINDRGGQPVVVRYNGGPQAAHNVRVNVCRQDDPSHVQPVWIRLA